MVITKDIDVVYNIRPEEFNKKYFIPQKPVVIKGLLENEGAGKKWSIDYFKSLEKQMTTIKVDNKNLYQQCNI